ncbi:MULTISPECIES: hypothetical protein [Rhizobium/Agrobacterium group]|uniref:hypothetical protein n=1 Tax=Rhizobium/Agrobacterium group TaxID=227290 RepID=UPI001FE08FEC|nr:MULTISPECIES: hypothetical protein [Rhizobium/Agrobacterium group]
MSASAPYRTRRHWATQRPAERIEPGPAVGIVQWHACPHLFDIRRGVEAVTFNEIGADAPGEAFSHRGFTAAGDAHDDHGSDARPHLRG